MWIDDFLIGQADSLWKMVDFHLIYIYQNVAHWRITNSAFHNKISQVGTYPKPMLPIFSKLIHERKKAEKVRELYGAWDLAYERIARGM